MMAYYYYHYFDTDGKVNYYHVSTRLYSLLRLVGKKGYIIRSKDEDEVEAKRTGSVI